MIVINVGKTVNLNVKHAFKRFAMYALMDGN